MMRKTRTQNLRDQAQDLADNLAPRLADAREQLAPRIADARDQLGPVVADARDKAKDKIVNEYLPLAQSAVAEMRENASPVTDEAKRRGVAAAAALKGEDPEPRHRSHKLRNLALLGVLGAAAVALKKLRGGAAATPSWQSSYVPPAAPTGDDSAGSTPDEAIADSDDAPHPVSTPDDPAEVIKIDRD
jgi:hypothetical protein